MNNISLTALLALPFALVLAWQSQTITDAQSTTARVDGRIAVMAAQINGLNRAIQETKQRAQTVDVETKTLARHASLTPAPVVEPTAAELVWDNGQNWIWFEKRLLPSLGVNSMQPDNHQFTEIKLDTDALSQGGQDLLARFMKECMAERASMPAAEAAKLEEDPVIFFRGWATNQPSATIEEITGVLTKLDEAMSAPRAGPTAFEVNPTAAALLGVSSAQLQPLQQAVNEFVARIRALERSHVELVPATEVKQSMPDKFGLKITPFADEGAQLKNEFQAKFQTLLGQERGNYWMEMAGPTLDDEFAGLGKEERKILVASNGRRYHAQQFRGNGGGPSTYTGYGMPYLDSWWRPLVRKTGTGFELITRP